MLISDALESLAHFGFLLSTNRILVDYDLDIFEADRSTFASLDATFEIGGMFFLSRRPPTFSTRVLLLWSRYLEHRDNRIDFSVSRRTQRSGDPRFLRADNFGSEEQSSNATWLDAQISIRKNDITTNLQFWSQNLQWERGIDASRI